MRERVPESDEFFVDETLNQLCRETLDGKWRIEPSVVQPQTWVNACREDSPTIPEQGWKLHIAAFVPSAHEVLLRCAPVLLAEDAPFKVAASLRMLSSLNAGEAGQSQVGKFITIYPRGDDQAVRLAMALDKATQGLKGPEIPTDRPLKSKSLVHYRYGGFGNRHYQTRMGEIVPALVSPDGELVPDYRGQSYNPPEWANDPFIEAGIASDTLPKHILLQGRYQTIVTVHRSPRNIVHFAMDIEELRRCIIKRVVSGDDTLAAHRLRHEADVLQQLAPDIQFPAVYDVFEDDGDTCVCMEDIEGEMLMGRLALSTRFGRYIPVDQVVAWGRELASALQKVHDKGYLYLDLKPANIMVRPSGQLCLLDFDIAYSIAPGSIRYGAGTPGYMSPQQSAEQQPTVADDIYGLGAVLYALATGAEPAVAPRGAPLTARPLDLMRPGMNSNLVDVINCCLEIDPEKRYPSMQAVKDALTDLKDCIVEIPSFGNAPLIKTAQCRSQFAELDPGYRSFARGLMNSICEEAKDAPGNTGLFWQSTHPATRSAHEVIYRDINTGCAGTLLALAELVAELGDDKHREVLLRGAHCLEDSQPIGEHPLPGLFVGEAGVATALLRSGQVLGDDNLVATAAERSRWIATLPYGSPEFFNGTAGRLRFHLWLWDVTREQYHLDAAVAAGETILNSAQEIQEGEIGWEIPPGYGGLSGTVASGYAHGAAGIADALLDLFETTREEQILKCVQGVGRWLQRLSGPLLDDESGISWVDMEGEPLAGAFWCRGSTGIGRFYLHCAELDVLPGAWDIVKRAAHAVARGARSASPAQCHGLSGNIEFLLDVYQATGRADFLNEAQSLACLLEAFGQKREGLLIWPSESPTVFTPDYNVGYAGVALCFLRLSDPEHLPHQLSSRNFKRSIRKSPARMDS